MSRKRPVVINFANCRVLLETIANYWPDSEVGRQNEDDEFGIIYISRSGNKIAANGNDPVARDEVIAFLDNYFRPVEFLAWKCELCAMEAPKCDSERSCYSYNNYKGFVRKEKHEPSTKSIHQEES